MIVDTHLHWPVGQDNDPHDLLGVLDAYGIDHAVVCGLEILDKLDTARKWNTLLSQFCSKAEGRLVALASVHLAERSSALSEAERCLAGLGMKGFKVHPWLQGEKIFDETMYGLCRLASEFRVPLMFHDGTPAYAMSSQVGVLAGLFPETTFILGHGGILHFWEEALEVTRQNDNVYITLCGGHPWGMQSICDAIGPDRILWGSDFVQPGAEEFIAYRKGLVERLNLNREQREKIMGQNARQLYWGKKGQDAEL